MIMYENKKGDKLEEITYLDMMVINLIYQILKEKKFY